MANCKEYILDDVMAIAVIPVSDVNLGTAEWQLTPTIEVAVFPQLPSSTITIGILPAVREGVVVPIMRQTGKAKDDENDSVAGRLHTVTVTCEVDERDSSVWNNLFRLEHTPSHLILFNRDGTTISFVAATQDTYKCTVERDDAKTSVTFRIENLMGLQPLVS